MTAGLWVLRRAGYLLAVLLLVTVGATALVDLTPGDPAFSVLGEQASPDRVAAVHAQLHLDEPFAHRYWRWLDAALHGDLGRSVVSQQSVLAALGERLPVTLELVVLAVVVALAVAVPAGVATAYRAGRPADRLWSAGSSVLLALPPFVTGLALVYLLALRDHGVRFPATGWVPLGDSVADNLWHAFLPALTLAAGEVPVYARVLRADLVGTLREDFVLAARAKGLGTLRILFRHALRPSSFSLVTLASLSIGRLVSGALVVEVLFALPGIGQLLVVAVQGKDIVIVQGLVVVVAVAYVVLNTAVDGLYGVLDPRARARAA